MSTPYGQTPYGQPAEHPKAQMVFIMGIVGIFVSILAFVAWYMGGQVKKEIEANPGGPYRFEGNVKTGYTLGKIFSILWIVGAVIYVIAMIAIFALAATGN